VFPRRHPDLYLVGRPKTGKVCPLTPVSLENLSFSGVHFGTTVALD